MSKFLRQGIEFYKNYNIFSMGKALGELKPTTISKEISLAPLGFIELYKTLSQQPTFVEKGVLDALSDSV